MTCGIILIQMIEKRYTVDILIHQKILPNVDNKLIIETSLSESTSILFRCLRSTHIIQLK